MFWKKKTEGANILNNENATSPFKNAESNHAVKKAKKLSKKDIVINQIEALQAGNVIRYKFPELCGGDLVLVELNSGSSDNGRSYTVSTQKMADGKPTGDVS